ncbi:MAG: YbhN family protein [Actinobacteria bacterium]|nr:YbhN family protein [Actinomycetota bacterium]
MAGDPDPPRPVDPLAEAPVLSFLRRRAWVLARYLAGIGLGAFALYVVLGKKGELAGATRYLAHMSWEWVALAVVVEAGSYVSFALLQRRLLLAGSVSAGTGSLTGLALASTAIANSFPAGPALASVYNYRRYRRYGADEAYAGWMLLGVFTAAAVSLAMFAAVGAGLASTQGVDLGLLGALLSVLLAALVLGALVVQRRALVWIMRRGASAFEKLLAGRAQKMRLETADLEAMIGRLNRVKLGWEAVLAALGWAMGNWVLDCACLALAYQSLGVALPWGGLLLAYGAGQLAANLPITPGGLGVVEGSLTIALVAYGGVSTSTVAAVLLYRIISFWLELPVGWALWGWAAMQAKRLVANPAPKPFSSILDRGDATGAIGAVLAPEAVQAVEEDL